MTAWTWQVTGRRVVGTSPAWSTSIDLVWGHDPANPSLTEFPWADGTDYPALKIQHIHFTLTTGIAVGGRRPSVVGRHGDGRTTMNALQTTGANTTRRYEFGAGVDLNTTGITPAVGALMAREPLPDNFILLPSCFAPAVPYASSLGLIILTPFDHSVGPVTLVGELLDQR